MNRKTVLKIALLAAVWAASATNGSAEEEASQDNAGGITIVAKAAKKSFRAGEPIIIGVALANFGDQSVYVPVSESQIFEPYFWIKDANGLVIGGGVIEDPNRTIHEDHYVEREGKRVLMVPVLEIKEQGVLLTFIPNALQGYGQKLAPGRYYLESFGFPMIFEPRSLMSRADHLNRLWAEAASDTVLVKPEPIELLIESDTSVP
jgi:hypothetical protein